MIYLVHKDFQGNPIGVWNEAEDSYYPEEHDLKKSANALIGTRFEGESWEEFSDRLSDRISHRDWWETHNSEKASLEEVWHEVVPSSESLNVR